MNYAFDFKEHGVFTPDGKADIQDVESYNVALEQLELAAWAERPDRFLGYYNFPAENNRPNKTYRAAFGPLLTGATVSTWLGTTIGTIVSANVYHNFGSRMVSMTVRGTNGAVYYGRASYDWGQCIRLRKAQS